MEKGTLYHMKNLINRTAVPKSNPEDSMKATEDFYLAVLHAHILAAAKTLLSKTSNLHSTISLAEEIVDRFVDIHIESGASSGDSVHEYAHDMLTLLMIWHNFHDSVKEGDGDRVILVWKLLMLIFKASNHHNYAKEAANLLLQKHCLLSQRRAAQLINMGTIHKYSRWHRTEYSHRPPYGTFKQMPKDYTETIRK